MGISLIHNVFIILDRFALANRNRTQREVAPAGANSGLASGRKWRRKEEIAGKGGGEFACSQPNQCTE